MNHLAADNEHRETPSYGGTRIQVSETPEFRIQEPEEGILPESIRIVPIDSGF